MNILDLDMDFFLDKLPETTMPNTRLSNDSFPVWSKEKVINYLETNLNLSKIKKVKGRIITHHDEALEFWEDVINKNLIRTPFNLYHVDSHSDLEFSDKAYSYICDTLLPLDTKKLNLFEHKEYINYGNYLLFAMSFEWVSKFYWIYNPNSDLCDAHPIIQKLWSRDNPNIYFKHNPNMSMSDVYWKDRGRLDINLEKYCNGSTISLEIPLYRTECKDFNMKQSFDLITFAISPNYTPPEADFIIDVIKEYIEEI